MTAHPAAHNEGPSPITLGSASAPLRRSLGAQAWCALECLAGHATFGADGAVTVASVRSLAAELGVAKNTAQRALAALVAAGFATPEQRRRPDGTFETGRYRLHLGDAITPGPDEPGRRSTSPRRVASDEPAPECPVTPTPRPTRRATRSARDAGQLSLLDA